MRNKQGYNSLTGSTAISDVQTLIRGRPKTHLHHQPRPFTELIFVGKYYCAITARLLFRLPESAGPKGAYGAPTRVTVGRTKYNLL